MLERVCAFFASHPGTDAITGDGWLATVEGRLASPLMAEQKNINARGMAVADYFMQPATFWRKNPLRLDESLSFTFDWKFFVALYRAGKAISYAPGFFAVYRPHEASKTTQDSARRRWEVCHVVEFAGAGPAQRAWCRLIYGVYALSERLGFAPLKRLAWIANAVMRRLSFGRVFSC